MVLAEQTHVSQKVLDTLAAAGVEVDADILQFIAENGDEAVNTARDIGQKHEEIADQIAAEHQQDELVAFARNQYI